MQHSRVNRFRHHVADQEVGVGCPKVARVALHSLAERGSRVCQLSFTGKKHSKSHGAAVKRVRAKSANSQTEDRGNIWGRGHGKYQAQRRGESAKE
jgi:hypothetical protein